MTQLLFIRHGPTEWNELKKLQGRTDISLSPKGTDEVRSWELPKKYASWNCATSPLNRAMETARLMGLSCQVEPALVEMSWGRWEGEVWQKLLAIPDPELDANRARGLDFRPPEGESPRDVQTRLLPWLASLREPTVAVSHKGVLQALYALATGWDINSKAPVKFKPACAHLFEVGPGTCEVLEMNISLKDPS